MAIKGVYTSKSDMVTALLRERILSGELRGSSVLRQRDIALEFGVSQTPVREALRRLESDGLVVSDAHRTSTVVENRSGPIENYQIRAALESLGAKLAADQMTDDRVQRLYELNREMESVGDDSKAYGALNREFHFTIYEYADSPLLQSLMRMLWRSMPYGPVVLRTHAESIRQHRALIEALENKDGNKAAEITREHILRSMPLNPDIDPDS